MHVNSICKFEEKDLAISSQWVMPQWTYLTTEVTLDRSKPHLVSRGNKYCHLTPVLAHTLCSWPSTGKIPNHRPVVECAKILCKRFKHCAVSQASHWIPTDCTPSNLWRIYSPNGSSGFFGSPPDDRCVVTIIKTTFCCRGCWYCSCCGWSSEVDGKENWKYQVCKSLRKATYERFYDAPSSGHER